MLLRARFPALETWPGGHIEPNNKVANLHNIVDEEAFCEGFEIMLFQIIMQHVARFSTANPPATTPSDHL